MGLARETAEWLGYDAFKSMYSGIKGGLNTYLHSNQAIMKAYDNNAKLAYKDLKFKDKIKVLKGATDDFFEKRIEQSEALNKKFKKGDDGYSTFQKAASAFYNREGQLQYGRIAGAYMGTMAAGRFASGGGVYRDSNGDFDIAGLPFI